MNNRLKIALIGVIIILVVGMLWVLGGKKQNGTALKNTYVSSDWDKKFELNDKAPYGLYLFNKLLKSHIDSSKKVIPIIGASALDSLIEPSATMVFVGNRFGLKDEEIETILSKVDQGASLFLSYSELTQNIKQQLFNRFELSYDFEDSVNIYVGRSKFTQYYLFQNDTLAYQWKGILDVEPVDSNFRSLSSFMDFSNFIRIPHGKGYIYVHTTPECFFNYQIKRPQGYRYTSFVLNHLPKNENVYLLELGRLLDDQYWQQTEESLDESQTGQQDDSYFQFLLKSPELIAAMGLTLLGLLLFLLFRAKRMQPVVPYIQPKKNMSIEFAQTITSIYLTKQYPYAVLQLQKKNFYDTVLKHYFIDLSREQEDREKEIESLAQKSNAQKEELVKLLKMLETKLKINVTDEYIAEVAKMQRKFYEDTGVIHLKVLQKVSELKGTIRREMIASSMLILTGILLVLTGFYFLMIALGVGIILWPLGAIVLSFGILRISRPLLDYGNDEIVWHPLTGKKQRFKTADLMSITPMKNGVTLNFTSNRKVTVNYWEMSRFDKAQFELFIAANHQIDLG